MPDGGRVLRHVRFTAKAGQGDELASRLLAAAEDLRGFPGCEVYLVSRDPRDSEAVLVTELWSAPESVRAALELPKSGERIAEVSALLDAAPELDETIPVGGVGPPPPVESRDSFTIRNLAEVEDMAKRFGYSEIGESRFAHRELEAERTGLSHHRLHPGRRQGFGHRHRAAEEIYVVLSGSGRVKLDDEIADLRALDAVRVGPGVTRQFEAGAEGLEFLALSMSSPGDAEMIPGWWTD